MTGRVLVAVVADESRPATEAVLTSLARLDGDIDILLLQDGGGDESWQRVQEAAAARGFASYRSPRRLTPPRAANLALLLAQLGAHDYVLLTRGDLILPPRLVPELLLAAIELNVGSVSAWAVDTANFPLDNRRPDVRLATPDVVESVSESLASQFSGIHVTLPAATPCVLIPVPVLREVGLFDPVFADTGAELTDWSLRALRAGYKPYLAPAVFVHRDPTGARSREANSAAAGAAVVQMRYPQFNDQLYAFAGWGFGSIVRRAGVRRIVIECARSAGYVLAVGWLPGSTSGGTVRCVIAPDGATEIHADVFGFEHVEPLAPGQDVAKVLLDLFGSPPARVEVYDHGAASRQLLESSQLPQDLFRYPTRV